MPVYFPKPPPPPPPSKPPGKMHTYINTDQKCRGCGYNLKGLPTSSKCPECGKAIAPKSRTDKLEDMIRAPIGFLNVMSWATSALLPAFLAMQITLYWALAGGGGKLFFAAGIAAAAWWLVISIVVRPRPRAVVPDGVEPMAEWFVLRLVVRITQAMWILAAGIGFISTGTGAAGGLPILFYLSGVGALAGLPFVCLYLFHLAYWANDAWLSNAYRSLVVVCPIGFVLLAQFVTEWSGNALQLLGTKFGVSNLMMGLLTLFFALTPNLILWWALYQTGSIGRWAVHLHHSVVGREERFRARAEEEARNFRLREEARHALGLDEPQELSSRSLRPGGKAGLISRDKDRKGNTQGPQRPPMDIGF